MGTPARQNSAKPAEKPVVADTTSAAGLLMRYGRSAGLSVLFFTGFFLFMLLYLDPAVLQAVNGFNIHSYVSIVSVPEASSFSDILYRNLFILELTPGYLHEIVSPGGCTRFAVTLIIYICHYRILGALAVTGLALLFYLLYERYIHGIGDRRSFVAGYVPALFILIACAWYELRFLSYLLPVAGALAFALVNRRLRQSAGVVRIVAVTALFWIAWYVMLWGSLLLFLFVVIDELSGRTRHSVAVVIAGAVNVAFFLVLDGFILPIGRSVRWGDFWMYSGLPLFVVGFFPLAAVVLAVAGRRSDALQGKIRDIFSTAQTVIVICMTMATVMWICKGRVNRETRTAARMLHHEMNGKWDAILGENTGPVYAGFPQNAGRLQVLMMQVVNHALCATGRLGDRLFSYPQAVSSYDPLIMLQSMNSIGYVNWAVVLDVAMDLGMLNTAERIAGELMENMGPYPDVMYRRALIQIATGNREAAAVYLRKLSHMPFHRAAAKRLLGIINDEAALFSDRGIAAMRANRDTVDYFLDNNLSGDVMLRYLLQSNPGNRMAYDYLVTGSLLYDQLDEMAQLLPAAPSFGYRALPRYWEEALCLYQSKSMGRSKDFSFSGVRQETVDRFFRFTDAWAKTNDDSDAAAKLAPVFGDTYFFYAAFRYSPGVVHE